MQNNKIEIKKNKKNEYEIFMNENRIFAQKYTNKIDAMQNAIIIGKNTPNIKEVIIRSDNYEE